MYTKVNYFIRIENCICNNDDYRWKIPKTLKFGMNTNKVIRKVYIYLMNKRTSMYNSRSINRGID